MAKDEGERRLAAILNADVAGHSRLVHDDEAATVETLTKCRAKNFTTWCRVMTELGADW